MEKEIWRLVLYIMDNGPSSREALDNVRRIAREDLSGNAELLVVDLSQTPEKAMDHNVLAVPTLIREFPLPIKRIIGSVSDSCKLARALDLPSANCDGKTPGD